MDHIWVIHSEHDSHFVFQTLLHPFSVQFVEFENLTSHLDTRKMMIGGNVHSTQTTDYNYPNGVGLFVNTYVENPPNPIC